MRFKTTMNSSLLLSLLLVLFFGIPKSWGFNTGSIHNNNFIVTPRLSSIHNTKSNNNYYYNNYFHHPTSSIVEGLVVLSQVKKRQYPFKITTSSKKTTSVLYSANSSDSTTSNNNNDEVDVAAIGTYIGAIVVQMTLFYLLFTGLDLLVPKILEFTNNDTIPMAVNIILFYIIALKSRVFNPMPNPRPQPKTLEVENKDKNNNMSNQQQKSKQRIMPSFTPPGIVFPIVWLLIIAPLRAVSSAMIYQTTHEYTTFALLAFILHLSIGDVWNTINNAEQRYGTSVLGVSFVWLSKAFAAYQYSLVLPMAGTIMSIPLIWLTIASTLVFQTWRLNPNPETNQLYPLLPTVGEAETKFTWFGLSDNNSNS